MFPTLPYRFLFTLAMFLSLQSKSVAQSMGAIALDDPTSIARQEVPPAIVHDDRALIDPNELVLHSVQQMVWGDGFACKVRQRTEHFGKEINSIGSCMYAGKGSGKLKYILRMTLDHEILTTEQMCDGRVLWTIQGPNQPFRTVQLERVQRTLERQGKWNQRQPELSLQLAIGGPAEILRTLYLKYRWFKISKGMLDGIPVWEIAGTFRTKPPSVVPHTPNDLQLAYGTFDSLPAYVRLTLGREAPHPLFPYRIEYFQQNPQSDGSGVELRRFSTIEFFEVQSRAEDAGNGYAIVLPDDNRDRNDETHRYLIPEPKGGNR